ncbi:MAG TPA: glycosyl transferase family 4 [Sphingobacteriaceae bacterium]|nr:glycosyl transferase family 4 [Sphingobacteriaceae bacterium]
MKILLFTSGVPFPAKSGYPIVVYNTIKGLTDLGAEVTVFSLNTRKHNDDVSVLNDPLSDKINLITAPINTEITIRRVFLSLFTKKSYTIFKFYQASSLAKLKNLLQHSEFDVIQLEGLLVMPYLDIIKQNTKAKIVYRAHNIEHQLLVSSERSFLRRLYFKILAKRLYRFERDNLNKPDAILTINISDQSFLKFLGCKVMLENFPVAIDPDNYNADISKVEYPSIFHLGAMDMLPNLESVQWFIQYVWNDLRQLNANLKFHIAGKDIPKTFYNSGEEDILLYNNIENAMEFMSSKAVMVVPLRSGSGMRVKIIEGMAMKKCIISTSLGAEGINYEHGKNILIADTPDEFYKYILQCTTDRKLCESIGENARKLVEKEYNIKHHSERLLAFYEDLIIT